VIVEKPLADHVGGLVSDRDKPDICGLHRVKPAQACFALRDVGALGIAFALMRSPN